MDLQQVLEQYPNLAADGFKFAPTAEQRARLSEQAQEFERAAAWLRENLEPAPNLKRTRSSADVRMAIEYATGTRTSHGVLIAAVIALGYAWRRDQRSGAINIGTMAATARRPGLGRVTTNG